MPWYSALKYLGKAAGGYAARRGVDYVGRQVSSYVRRKRRQRAWRNMKAYRVKSALGLQKMRILSTTKNPVWSWSYPSQSKTSNTYRFCPLGHYSNYYYNLYDCDARFAALAGLYRQFRIVNMTVSLRMQSTPFSDEYGYVSFAGKVIRNCQRDTPFTDFWDGATPMDTPGIVWRKNDQFKDKLPGITMSVWPVSTAEKDQWYDTVTDGAGNNADYAVGADMAFCPAIDFCTIFTRQPPNAGSFAVAVLYRVTIEFRDAVDAALPSSKSIEIEKETIEDLAPKETETPIVEP